MPPGLRVSLEVDPADERLPLGLRRCGGALVRIQGAVARAQVSLDVPFGQALLVGGARTSCFQLEALLRLYADIHDRERLDAVRRDVKVLEDALGAVDIEADLVARGAERGLPAAVRERFALRHAEACGRLRGWAEARGWVAHAEADGTERLRASKLARKLRKVDWPGADDDAAALARALSEQLRSTHAEIERLDLRELEDGVHEVRRRVRWFSIYMSALDGAVQLDTEAPAPSGWERYLTDEVRSSPFHRLPPALEGVRALRWPAPLCHALIWTIAELGRLKDRAQRTAGVQAALHAAGNDAPATRWLGEEALSEAEACERGQEVVERVIHADRLLVRCAEALEEQV